MKFSVGHNEKKMRASASPAVSKRARSTEPKSLQSGLDSDDEPRSFIKENRFASVGTPAPILRKTGSKSGKRSLVEKPLLHRMPIDLDTDQSGSTMTMSRSGVSGLSSALSNSRDQDDIEMTTLQVGPIGRVAQRSARLGRPDRPGVRRRPQDAPTPDLILNGMLGAGQTQLASTSSSEGGGGK